jgi:rfaE bifunctional protein kinase chain/domain
MDNFNEAIEQFRNKRILVIGDLMLDQYTFGQVSRISPEAPVPILHKQEEKFVLGGAGNVANNLASLGAKVILCAFVGDDSRKGKILELLRENGIDSSCIITYKDRPTILKHRLVAGGHQLLRLDEEVIGLDPVEEEELISAAKKEIGRCDGLIFSDYAKGVASKKVVSEIIREAKKQRKLVVADIKPENKEIFFGVDVITPNLKEGIKMSGVSRAEDVGEILLKDLDSSVVLTMGENGIYVFDKSGSRKHLPSRKVKVFDVSGAGDTATALVALGLLCGLDLVDASYLANLAGEIVVQKAGTSVLSAEELKSALGLGGSGHIAALDIVPKVWGFEKWLENNDKYCSKLLSLNKGYQCSLHYHKIKDEMFLVAKGHIRLELGDKVLHLKENNFIRIPPGTHHRFRGLEDSEILEVSTHHDDSDSYRIEKSKKVDDG